MRNGIFFAQLISFPLLITAALADGVTGVSNSADNPAANKIPAELKDATITEHLGDQVSIQELEFKDETGKPTKLANYFSAGKPVLLSLVYYGCPNLCTFSLNGMVDSLKGLDWTPGNQFNVVTLSINPKEGADLALQKRDVYLREYGRAPMTPGGYEGWHFLTGEEAQIQKLAKQVGFGYRWDEKEQQYAHSAALFVLTPEGKISRYLFGIQYEPKDLRMALLEASNGKIGSLIDKLVLFCFHYNPQTRKYSLYVSRLMQIASVGMVLILGLVIFTLWRREKLQPRESNAHV